ncbi:excinuclease ABC subunit A [Streptococcus mitis]|uniref:Excinuclease ABC subunit A n=1 Tax=Streptococcus mitis TaxID=28037 RepID=A0A1X1KHP1_STRMT|nr:excinuclease ABC subunit A [Streptococcus mitis]
MSRKKYENDENDEKSQKNLKIGRKSDVFYGIID